MSWVLVAKGRNTWGITLSKWKSGEFLGCAVVRTPCFHCWGHWFDPWSKEWTADQPGWHYLGICQKHNISSPTQTPWIRIWILTRFPGDSHALPSLKHPTSLSGERDYWDKRPRSSLVMLLLWWLLCGKCIAWFLACVHSLDKCLWAPVLCQLLCWFLGIESSRRIGPALIFYILVKF